MTITDVTLGMNQQSTSFGPFAYGSHAGTPVVDFSVSESDSNQLEIRSIDSLLESYNWKRKLSSGFARIQFNAENVFKEQHAEGISELSRLINARFVDFEVNRGELGTMPPREVKNVADFYSVFVPGDYDFDEDVMEFFSNQANSFGSAEFIFKIDSSTDDQYVNQIVNEYNLYDSDVWLFPKGWKAETVSERFDYAEGFAKSNAWNVSPRMGIMSQASEEIKEVREEDE
jgi:hypothetical protein